MSPRYEVTLTLSKQRGIQIADAAMHLMQSSNCGKRSRQSANFGFLSRRSSSFIPPTLILPASPALSFLRAQERNGEVSGAGSSQSERAERRYLKHMQRVQLRSGSPLLVRKEGQKVSDNGGLHSAARNPTHDDLCDLGDDDGPPSLSSPPPSSLPPFTFTSFSFALLVAIERSARVSDRHSRSAHSFDENAKSRKVRDTRSKTVEVRLSWNSLCAIHSNYRRSELRYISF